MNLQNCIAAARLSGPLVQPDGFQRFEFRFGGDAPFFAGHFPGHPILPGVFQLEMARLAAEWVLGCPLAVREISKAKFQRPILPDEVIRVSLKYTEANPRSAAVEPSAGGTVAVTVFFAVNGQAAGETHLHLAREGTGLSDAR